MQKGNTLLQFPRDLRSRTLSFIFITTLMALFIPGSALAQTAGPTYIGNYAYNSTWLADSFHVPDFSDEAAAVNAHLAKQKEVGGGPYCAYSAGNPSVWAASKVVEGTEASATHTYPINATTLNEEGACAKSYPYPVGSIEIYRRRVVCSSTQRFKFGACMSGTFKTQHGADGANFGPPCDRCNAKGSPHPAEPIDPSSGNMWHQFTDFQVLGPSQNLSLTRTYNSSRAIFQAQPVPRFGRLWSQLYDARLIAVPVPNRLTETVCWVSNTQPPIVECGPNILVEAIPEAVSIARSDGKSYTYILQGSHYINSANNNDRLVPAFNATNSAVLEWTYTSAQGDVVEHYDQSGVITSIIERNGRVLRLTYSTGATNDTAVARIPLDAPVCSGVQAGSALSTYRLLCVTDGWGRQLNFRYDAKGHVVEVIDPNNASHFYEYDGVSGGCTAANAGTVACAADNLTKVTHPDGSSQTYLYNEAARINNGAVCATIQSIGNGVGPYLNAMTGVVDENGDRFLSWTYDCNGRATSSEVATGINKVNLAYQEIYESGATFTTVTHTLGTAAAPQTTATTFSLKFLLGVGKNTQMSATCAECGTIKTRTYDANANVASTTDFNGNVTTYAYDLVPNLETQRVEASGTAIARTTTTSWHSNFRLPLQIAEPKHRTSYTYDLNGNQLTRSEQATLDQSGALGLSATTTGLARVWTNTYNATGQILTATGPRTDVADVTTYVYDEMGNLLTVTNALGQITTLSNYDANGRVGRIAAPNGTATELTYSSRGWLASRTVTGGGASETTTYDYDSVGQLKKVTAPDASFVTYTYDAAHRLIGVADSLGNSVTYTLDLTGNRIKEQVADPGGSLARQISRVYDTLNRLQQQTGGVQ